jgi:DNA modification methylase
MSSYFTSYNRLANPPSSAPERWQAPCAHSECSTHQLSPYIGKLKSSIAYDLIKTYSRPGDLIVEPFSGAGTVPLEAILLNRHVFAADISPYSKILTKAKLAPPSTIKDAMKAAELTFKRAAKQPEPDLRRIPKWIRSFFHLKTLKEAIKYVSACRLPGDEFLIACFLGILHHERPGFLSYPSSHLVPYLRDKKYPKAEYPEMYKYREFRPRLISKIKRAYKRAPEIPKNVKWEFRQSSVENLTFPKSFDCLITSPPYMNTLNYSRDNRLRLWFINPNGKKPYENAVVRNKKFFKRAICCMAKKIEQNLKRDGHCVLIVGDLLARSKLVHLSENIFQIMAEKAPSLRLISVIKDDIPDIRRSRKNCKATKTEHILVFQKK